MLTPSENLPITAEETNLSPIDVISISIHNLIAFVSNNRPWLSEFLALSSINCPTSLFSVASSIKVNFHHFKVNYFLLLSASITLFLINDPRALLTVASFVLMWLLLYVYRDHPLVFYGRLISDRLIIFGLVLGSIWALWFANCFLSLVLGVIIGFFICLVHAIVRNSDDLFVPETEVVTPSKFLHWS